MTRWARSLYSLPCLSDTGGLTAAGVSPSAPVPAACRRRSTPAGALQNNNRPPRQQSRPDRAQGAEGDKV